ncbi:MAG: dimethylamine corrinoid protein MtbC [Methanomassiliicoccus sp.]|nr:dimethylamine corrinoid protein MtbC [Methanomassiliicoccus sp.]
MTTAESARKELSDAIVAYNKDRVVTAVQNARTVLKPQEIIDALASGMNEVGVRFERGKLFLPHVMVAADAMTMGVKVIEGDLPKGASNGGLGVIVTGTVEGDVHDIGKSIVSTMLQCAGYKVFDLGRDVPIRNFIESVKENNACMVGMSALMTTTMQSQKECIDLLKEEGLRTKVKVMVGGAPATQAWADKIGADGYGENASEAVHKANELLGNK